MWLSVELVWDSGVAPMRSRDSFTWIFAGESKKKPMGPKPEPRRSPQVPLISGFYRDSLIEERGEGTITLMTLGFLRKYKEPLGRSKAITSCTLLSLGDTRRGQTPQINVLSCTVTFGGGGVGDILLAYKNANGVTVPPRCVVVRQTPDRSCPRLSAVCITTNDFLVTIWL